MKAKRINPFLVAYVVCLMGLAVAGYMVGDYTIRAELHKTLRQEYFTTDLALYDLPRININMTSNSKTNSNRLRVDVSLEVAKQDLAKLSRVQPRITDRLVTFMRKQDIEEVRPPTAMVWLHRVLLEEVNDASRPVPIRDIVFRQFIVL